MECKEFEKMIPLFLNDELDTEELREFTDHVDKCSECREELSIQFLVTEGLASLEDGNVFNLQNELEEKLNGAEHGMKVRENMRYLLFGMEGMVALLMAIIALLLFILN